MRQKDDGDASTVLKITNQCRLRSGMEYGLKCAGVNLTLVIAPRRTEGDRDEWHVSARAGRRRDEAVVVVEEWGATPADALEALGRTFGAALPDQRFPMFDWGAVARVLREVKAL